MVVDTTLRDEKFNISAYTSRTLALGDKQLATEFVEIPCDTIFGDVERVGGACPRRSTAAADGAGDGGERTRRMWR